MIEQIIAREQLEGTGRQFYFFRTYAGAEVDLIVDRGSERIGYEFKCAVSTGPKDWANLKKGMDDGIIHKGFLVYLGERDFPVSKDIEIVGAEHILIS